MMMDRRAFIGLGAGVPFLPGPVFEKPEADRPLWFTIRGTGMEEPIAIGAWGRRATFSVGELLKAALREFGTEDPAATEVRIGHETEGRRLAKSPSDLRSSSSAAYFSRREVAFFTREGSFGHGLELAAHWPTTAG